MISYFERRRFIAFELVDKPWRRAIAYLSSGRRGRFISCAYVMTHDGLNGFLSVSWYHGLTGVLPEQVARHHRPTWRSCSIDGHLSVYHHGLNGVASELFCTSITKFSSLPTYCIRREAWLAPRTWCTHPRQLINANVEKCRIKGSPPQNTVLAQVACSCILH